MVIKPVQPKNRKPPIITIKQIEAICDGITNGLHPRQAALRAGIKKDTYYKYRNMGEQGISPYSDIVDAIKKAEANLEYDVSSDILTKIKASKNPIAGIVFLDRRFPQRWSQKTGGDNTLQTAIETIRQLVEINTEAAKKSNRSQSIVSSVSTPEATDQVKLLPETTINPKGKDTIDIDGKNTIDINGNEVLSTVGDKASLVGGESESEVADV